MKKIIALIAVLAVTVSILNIMAYATDISSDTMTSKEYRVAQSNLIDKYANGDITFTDFQERSQAVTNEYIAKNTVDGVVAESALTVGNTMTAITNKMANVVQNYGDDARGYVKDWWNDACNKNNLPTETTQTSTTDMRGFGARIDQYIDGNIFNSKYGDYAVLERFAYSNGNVFYSLTIYPQRSIYVYPNNPYNWTSGYFENYASNSGAAGLSEAGLSNYKWYGDVRYKGFDEGTEPIPDDEFTYGTIHNFNDMNDKQISDLINDFAEELELQNPDLSSLEGLLTAIYARLGTLDSDNDNDLLSQINTSIKSLNSSISDLSTSIEASINDLKETITSLLTNEDKKDDDNIKDDSETEKHEIAGTLYNVIPLEKSWLKKFSDEVFDNKANLKVEYEGKVYYLEDDGTLKLGDKYYKVDMNYSSTLDEILDTLLDIRDSLDLLSEEEKEMSFNDFFDLKLSDLKSDFDEKFEFKDNIKEFIDGFFDSIKSAVPEYES